MNTLKVYDVRVLPGDASFLLDDGKTAILYDAGFGFTGYGIAENIRKMIGSRQLDYIFLTHSHYDHVLGSAAICRVFPEAKVVASARTAYVFTRPGALAVMKDLDDKYAQRCGETPCAFLGSELHVDIVVSDGDVVEAGDMKFEVVELPGHTFCSIGFYLQGQEMLLACESLGVYNGGDVIVPSVLVGCKAALSSIERVCKMKIRKILMPHYGMLTDEETAFYLQNCYRATENCISFVYDRLQAGKSNEEIIADFFAEFRKGTVCDKYPLDAATLNTNIMINLVRKELLGQST